MERDTVKLTPEGTEEVLRELRAPAEDNDRRRGLFERMRRIAERLANRVEPPIRRVVPK